MQPFVGLGQHPELFQHTPPIAVSTLNPPPTITFKNKNKNKIYMRETLKVELRDNIVKEYLRDLRLSYHPSS